MRFKIKWIWVILGLLFSLGMYSVIVIVQDIQNEPNQVWLGPWPEADCGVVLTGAPGRIRDGFEYLAQKKIKKLIVSGVYKEAQFNELFPYLPFYPEVNPKDIYLEKRSETTFGNAQQSLTFVEALNCSDIVLMTSQIHMSRSYKVFRTAFPQTIIIKKLSLPNAKNEKTVWGLTLEVFKSFFYLVFSLV